MNQFDVNWEVADRWHAQFEFEHQRERHDNNDPYDWYPTQSYWQLLGQVRVNYFIEDRTSIYAVVSHMRGKNNDYYYLDDPYDHADRSDSYFGIGMTYQFFGGLSSRYSPRDRPNSGMYE